MNTYQREGKTSFRSRVPLFECVLFCREELQRLTVGGARGYHATVRKLRSLQQSIDLWDVSLFSLLWVLACEVEC